MKPLLPAKMIALVSMLLITACGPIDKSSIAEKRPVGCECGDSDSASIKRAPWHPLGPTGGWYSKTNQVNYDRTMDLKENYLTMSDRSINGYVKFDTDGYLQARSYDDEYGDVYCGWSPNKLEIKPTKQYVFVTLGQCSVGDGGLDQVHEVAWFPKGEKKGRLVFSSKHPSKSTAVTAADLYQPALLGNSNYFNFPYAKDVLSACFKEGKADLAQIVLKDSISVFDNLSPLFDPSKGRKIPVKGIGLNPQYWEYLSACRLGNSVGQPGFDEALKSWNDTKKSSYSGSRKNTITPLFVWLNSRLLNEKGSLPAAESAQDASLVIDYLSGKSKESDFLKSGLKESEFWVGAKRYLDGDYKGASDYLMRYLSLSRPDDYARETAAAGRLKQLTNEKLK